MPLARHQVKLTPPGVFLDCVKPSLTQKRLYITQTDPFRQNRRMNLDQHHPSFRLAQSVP
jgi:hypothetical protein